MDNSVRYVTIYDSEVAKVELSTNGIILRRKGIQNNRHYEYLYERVTDPVRIRAIEERSVNWMLLEPAYSKNHYVLRQADAQNRPTGNIKVVEKKLAFLKGFISLSVDARPEDFSYYERRKG